MKDHYNINVSLLCITCGGGQFDYNEDKTYVKCQTCNREYLKGYDELVELNEQQINEATEELGNEIAKDAMNDITKSFKKAFKNSKIFKIK